MCLLIIQIDMYQKEKKNFHSFIQCFDKRIKKYQAKLEEY